MVVYLKPVPEGERPTCRGCYFLTDDGVCTDKGKEKFDCTDKYDNCIAVRATPQEIFRYKLRHGGLWKYNNKRRGE